MKFFTRKVVVKTNEQADPRSQAFVDRVTALLEEHGVSDDTKRKQCAFYLFQSTKKFYKGIARDLEVDDGKLAKMAGAMKETLTKFGVVDEEDQESIILEYFTMLNAAGAAV